ncbi:MAG: hypothetical protein ACE5EK_10840, partial [Nitrospinales bacterium]
MKIYLSSSQDFNQMLVTSVFVHFLIFTFVLFLPKMTEEPLVIIPSFKMEMVEIVSPGRKRNKPAKVRAREVAPKKITTPKKETAPTEVPKVEAPKKIETPSPVLQELEKLSDPAKNPAILQELDQIAKLTPDVPERPAQQDKISAFEQPLKNLNELKNKKVPLSVESPVEKRSSVLDELESMQELKKKKIAPPLKSRIKKKNKRFSEDTFQELERLKNQKITPQAPKTFNSDLQEDPLQGFEDLKKKIKKPELAQAAEMEKTPDDKVLKKEKEFESFSKKSIKAEKKTRKNSKNDLLKELEQMKALQTAALTKAPPEVKSTKAPKKVIPKVARNEELFQPILKKLDKLEKPFQRIDIQVARNVPKPKAFSSGIRKQINSFNSSLAGESEIEQDAAPPEGAANEVSTSPDVLALYVGLIH